MQFLTHSNRTHDAIDNRSSAFSLHSLRRSQPPIGAQLQGADWTKPLRMIGCFLSLSAFFSCQSCTHKLRAWFLFVACWRTAGINRRTGTRTISRQISREPPGCPCQCKTCHRQTRSHPLQFKHPDGFHGVNISLLTGERRLP